MNVPDCLTPDRIVFLSGATKRDAITELIDLLGQSTAVEDRYELQRAIWRREEMMSTGIGMGVGVPHVRLSSVRAMVMTLGVHREGLRDYVSVDDAPVHIIALIAARDDQHTDYIRLLAQVVEVLKRPQAREAILNGKTQEEVYEILRRKDGE